MQESSSQFVHFPWLQVIKERWDKCLVYLIFFLSGEEDLYEGEEFRELYYFLFPPTPSIKS